MSIIASLLPVERSRRRDGGLRGNDQVTNTRNSTNMGFGDDPKCCDWFASYMYPNLPLWPQKRNRDVSKQSRINDTSSRAYLTQVSSDQTRCCDNTGIRVTYLRMSSPPSSRSGEYCWIKCYHSKFTRSRTGLTVGDECLSSVTESSSPTKCARGGFKPNAELPTLEQQQGTAPAS